MADISTELGTIQTASRGEEVRDAVVSAIKKINDQMTSQTSNE